MESWFSKPKIVLVDTKRDKLWTESGKIAIKLVVPTLKEKENTSTNWQAEY